MKKNIYTIILTIIITLNIFTFPVSATIKGDIDNDNRVSAVDARLALRMSVGLEELDMVADVDGDGKIAAADARLILRVSVGLETFENNKPETPYFPWEDPNYDDSNLDIMSIYDYSPIRAGFIYNSNGNRTTYNDLDEGEMYFEYDKNGYSQLRQKPYKPGNKPIIDRDHCSDCGKKMQAYNGEHYGCYYGYCSKFMKNMNCPECGEYVKAMTCHTCR